MRTRMGLIMINLIKQLEIHMSQLPTYSALTLQNKVFLKREAQVQKF